MTGTRRTAGPVGEAGGSNVIFSGQPDDVVSLPRSCDSNDPAPRQALGAVLAARGRTLSPAEPLPDLDELTDRRMRDLPAGSPVTWDQMRAAVEQESPVVPVDPCRFIDWPEWWTRDHGDAAWLLDRVLAHGRGHAIYATQKTGKSLFMLWAAASLATSANPARVLYLDFEMTDADVFERLSDMGYGPHTDLSRLRYALLPTLGPLDTAAGGAELLRLVDAELLAHPDEPLLVVLDTFTRAVEGDENSNDTTRAFYRHTGLSLKQRGVTWVRLDHAGKDVTRGQRGGSAKGDDVDVVWRLDRTDDGFSLRRDVARMTWVPERVAVRRHTDPLRFAVGGDAWPAGTRDLADRLAELGVPRDATVKLARAALKAADQTASTELLAAAVRYRKSGGTPDGTPQQTPGGTPDGTAPGIGPQQGGTPDGTPRNDLHSPGGTFPPPRGGTSADRPTGEHR